MKKLTAMLLTACFAVAIVGCTEEKTTTKAKDATGKTTSATTTEKRSKLGLAGDMQRGFDGGRTGVCDAWPLAVELSRFLRPSRQRIDGEEAHVLGAR